MAQPNQPASNHNLNKPKVKAPVPIEPISTPQEQRESITGTLTQPVTPEGAPPRGSFDASSILHVDSIRSQAVALKRLNAAQGREAAAHIGTTQGNRHLTKVVSSLQRAPSKPQAPQPKLTVSEPDDRYEQEADQVADQVMRRTAPPPPPAGEDQNKPGVQRSPSLLSGFGDPLLGLGPSLFVQAARVSTGAPDVTPELEQNIQQIRGAGHPLPGPERAFFEARMGVDLGQVRVHTGTNAVHTSRDLSARAHTVGAEIAFNEGQYRPGSSDGRRLLAHELAHVVQQRGIVQRQEGEKGGEPTEYDILRKDSLAAAVARRSVQIDREAL